MNGVHRWICRSGIWRSALQNRILPWALAGTDLGPDLLEVGPGYGTATDLLRERRKRLAAVEIDPALAGPLARRFQGTNVSVVGGNGAALPFRDGAFSGAVCFTMLHHVPSAELQNRLLREVRRVLRPGGIFAGTDSLWSRGLAWLHYRDTLVPIDPERFGARLENAGFERVEIELRSRIFRFRAYRG